MIGGFTNYAQLRLRDHRPGPNDYELPPGFGPGSESSKRSFLSRHPDPPPDTNDIGPGHYPLPPTIGQARCTSIGAPLPRDENGNVVVPVPPSSTAEAGSGKRRHPSPSPLPKQFSMALDPDTPAYSFYGRLRSGWQDSTTGTLGPGAYDLPRLFDRSESTKGVVPGASFGVRTELPTEREQRLVPGPGTYDLKRFGDVGPPAREHIHSVRRRGATEVTPGPGDYSDPNSISNRAARQRQQLRLGRGCTFGARHESRRKNRAGPGPAEYDTRAADVLLERNRRHAPRIMPPSSLRALNGSDSPTRKGKKDRLVGPLPSLPSEFDYDSRKGFSLVGRWPSKPLEKSAVGPGSYDTSYTIAPPSGGRLTAAPYDPYATLRAEAAAVTKEEAQRRRDTALAKPRDIHYDLVEPRPRCAVLSSSRDDVEGRHRKSVPGPGHYHPNYDVAKSEAGGGTLFYKGDFHERSGASAATADEAGPGAYYADTALYSGSIAGSAANGKGFTFGVRYPARATHQVAPPYDATTNTNCVYPGEQTWEVSVTGRSKFQSRSNAAQLTATTPVA